MESIDKTINIRVEYKDLIKGMSESAKRIDALNDRISELKAGLKELRAERKAGTIDEEAYNERVAQTTQELAANRAEVKGAPIGDAHLLARDSGQHQRGERISKGQ